MKIAGVASRLPENVYPQHVLTDAFARYWGERLVNPSVLKRIHSRTGVRSRHLAYPLERYAQFQRWGETNAAWLAAAEKLGADAIDMALERAGVARREVDALFIVSITGVACPSIDAKLVNRMGLRSDVKRTPIFGLGCAAGAIGLTRAADYVRAYPDQTAILLAVELCSLTMQRDDLSTLNLISTGLFADGAAAAVVTGKNRTARGPEIIATRSVFYPDTERIMGWDITERGFSLVLSPDIPDIARCRLKADVDAFLADQSLSLGDIGCWIAHPGGPKVLEAIEAALKLNKAELAASWESLAKVGNMSSASVLCVLEDTILDRHPEPGTIGIIVALGPGFCAEMLLVRW